jgi:hypothetical protein
MILDKNVPMVGVSIFLVPQIIVVEPIVSPSCREPNVHAPLFRLFVLSGIPKANDR